MKITIEHYGDTFIANMSEDSDIIMIKSTLKGLLIAAGWHHATVEYYFPSEIEVIVEDGVARCNSPIVIIKDLDNKEE